MDFIAVNCLPLSTVESVEFKELFGEKEFKFKIPSRWKLTHSLLPSRASLFFKDSLATVNSSRDRTITLEFDGWKSSNGLKVLVIVATNQEGSSTLLDLIDMTEESETSGFLSSTIVNRLEYLVIAPRKVNALVTDEGSAYKSARESVTREPGYEETLEYRCMAHLFNLVG